MLRLFFRKRKLPPSCNRVLNIDKAKPERRFFGRKKYSYEIFVI
jgi:hypothetical protein